MIAYAEANALVFTFEEGKLLLESKDKEMGRVHARVAYTSDATSYLVGKKIAFNPLYIDNAANATVGDEICLTFTRKESNSDFANAPVRFDTSDAGKVMVAPCRAEATNPDK